MKCKRASVLHGTRNRCLQQLGSLEAKGETKKHRGNNKNGKRVIFDERGNKESEKEGKEKKERERERERERKRGERERKLSF